MNADYGFRAIPAWIVAGCSMAMTVAAAGFEPPEMAADLEVASGFELEVAAAPPLVGYPLMACFDDRGRLYVAESDGRNLTTKEAFLQERPRWVRQLVDTDGDGRFDRSTIFADQMTMPEGGLWHDGALYIISAPYLWRLEDIDDDGVADRRERILGYMEFDGRANQHGPYLGPNGRLYFSGGHFGFDLQGSDGSQSGQSRSAGVFSCWPDGSDVRIEGQGPVNPVDVVFTPEGELITTCAIYDSVGGRHDALVHWVPGGLTQRVYGLPLLPDTGYRLPSMTRWGQVAPGGFMRYRHEIWGADYKNSYLACHFNGHRLVSLQFTPRGASFVTEEQDMVWSKNVDFHPADVLEAPDGSVLLLDTGGWLSWGCPYSKEAKPQIQGAIYRIRKQDRLAERDGLGDGFKWVVPEVVVGHLADGRPFVRDRARDWLIDRGASVVDAVVAHLESTDSAEVRRRIVWVLSQVADPKARLALLSRLDDVDAGVRQAVVRSLGELKEGASVAAMLTRFPNETPAIRRAIATAVGQIRSAEAVPVFLDALGLEDDLMVRHALIYALVQIGDAGAVRVGLAEGASPLTQQAALRILSLLGTEHLAADDVLPFLGASFQPLQAEAQRIVAARGDWTELMLDLFVRWADLRRERTAEDEWVDSMVQSLADVPGFQAEVARILGNPVFQDAVKQRLLVSLSFLSSIPDQWDSALALCLTSESDDLRRSALEVLAGAGKPQFRGLIRNLSRHPEERRGTRIRAAAVLARETGILPGDVMGYLAGTLRDTRVPTLEKRAAADALGALRLDLERPEPWDRLLVLISAAGPMELEALLRPFIALEQQAVGGQGAAAQVQLSTVGSQLLGLLNRAVLQKGLKAAVARAALRGFGPTFESAGATLFVDQEDEQAHRVRLDALAELAPSGNGSRGRGIFYSGTAACSVCHRVQGVGGTLGPDLSQIGAIREPRDLLEAILRPSATLVNGYESYTVTLKNDEVHRGLMSREDGAALFLRDASLTETRIPRDRVAQMEMGTVSIMPEGLDAVLTQQELLDLVDFLVNCR